jgi:hypothetical protein
MKKNFRAYTLVAIQRCEANILTMTDPERIVRATSYLNHLKRAYRKGVPRNEDNSVDIVITKR